MRGNEKKIDMDKKIKFVMHQTLPRPSFSFFCVFFPSIFSHFAASMPCRVRKEKIQSVGTHMCARTALTAEQGYENSHSSRHRSIASDLAARLGPVLQ